jgi:hypothetical protein
LNCVDCYSEFNPTLSIPIFKKWPIYEYVLQSFRKDCEMYRLIRKLDWRSLIVRTLSA